jgi:hypothetical protein
MLLIAYYLLLVADYLLLIAYCLLGIAYEDWINIKILNLSCSHALLRQDLRSNQQQNVPLIKPLKRATWQHQLPRD